VNANVNPGGNYKAITPSSSQNPNPFTKGSVNSNLPTDIYSSIEIDGKKNISFNVTGDKSYLIAYKELSFGQEVGMWCFGISYIPKEVEPMELSTKEHGEEVQLQLNKLLPKSLPLKWNLSKPKRN
jgi:hypothetical protein